MGLDFDTGVTGYEHVGIRAGDSGTSPVFVNSTNAYGKNIGETAGTGIATGKVAGITTDPSKSGMIVDKTVPSGWNLYYYVGDTVQDASLINAGAVLGQLSDKISRTAASDKELVVGWGMPDYTAGISVSYPTEDSPFVAPKKGIFTVMIVKGSSVVRALYINGVESFFSVWNTSGYQDMSTMIVPLDAGDSVYFNQASGTQQVLGFYPFKGV